MLQLSIEVDISSRKGISQHDQVLLVSIKNFLVTILFHADLCAYPPLPPTLRLVALAISMELTTEQVGVFQCLLRTVQCCQD